MIQVICGDCLDVMPTLGEFDCVFMDPPDNIGLDYGAGGAEDNRPTEEYLDWLARVVLRATAQAGTVWLSFNSRWVLRLAARLEPKITTHDFKDCVQTFTFGQHRHTDFGNNHRPLWRFQRIGVPFYADQIRVESWRQANGDKRANPEGRVPGDVFDFPRVTGNSKQRRAWHPTQLHEGLVERCILSCTKPGGTVLDPFAGTGTTGRVCQRIGRNCVLIEKSESYCEKIERDLFYDEIGIADGADTPEEEAGPPAQAAGREREYPAGLPF